MSDPIRLAQQIATAPLFETAILDELRREVGFEVAWLWYKGHPPTVVGLLGDKVGRALLSGGRYEQELEPVKRAAFAAHGVAVDTAVLGASRKRLGYFRDFVAPLGGQHSLLGWLRLRGQTVGSLVLGRTGSPFLDHDVRHVEGLVEPLTIARASFGPPIWNGAPLCPEQGALSRLLGFADNRILSRVRVRWGEIVVRDRRGYREMVARHDGMDFVWSRAALRDPSRSGWPYIDLFHVAASLAEHRSRALFIGCGGAVSPRQFARAYPGIEMDIVEHEPRVIELARRHFGLDTLPRATVHVADGVAFIAAAPAASWDVVVIDAYDALELSPGFCAPSFFASLRRVVRPRGAIAVNLIGPLQGRSPIQSAIDAARAEFGAVRLLPVVEPDEDDLAHNTRNIVCTMVHDAAPR